MVHLASPHVNILYDHNMSQFRNQHWYSAINQTPDLIQISPVWVFFFSISVLLLFQDPIQILHYLQSPCLPSLSGL